MTQNEKDLMAGQIKCLEKTIDNYQASISMLEGSEAILLLAKGIKNTARELGKLEGLFEKNIYINWKCD